MYGKIFKQIYKGTLAMVGPWEALVTFQQMIILADKDGVVDMTADALSRETTIPLKIIKKGIEALESPDPESRTPDHEGRRIIRLSDARSWGWQLVNYEHYRKLRSEEERREYHRNYWREKRSKSATKQTSTETQQTSTDSTNGSKQEVVSKGREKGRASRFAPIKFVPTDAAKKWAKEEGFSEDEVRQETFKFLDHEFAKPKKDWNRAWRNWMRKAKEWKLPDDKTTVQSEAERLGLVKSETETDEMFQHRLGVALTQERYG